MSLSKAYDEAEFWITFRMCDTGWLGRELQFLRAFADLHEILQTWVQLQGRLVVWRTEALLAAFSYHSYSDGSWSHDGVKDTSLCL